jgi:sugar lactone lactonase YvrE
MRKVRSAVSALVLASAVGFVAPAPAVGATSTKKAKAASRPADQMRSLVLGPAVAVSTELNFAEGPLWVNDRLLVSEVQGSKVSSFTMQGEQRTFQATSGRANGHALTSTKQLIQAEHDGRVVRVAADGTETMLADRWEGKRFNSPNDVALSRDRSIVFTDPDFGLEGRSSEIGFNGVFRLDPTNGNVRLLSRDLKRPNGIAFSPDGRTLFVTTWNGLYRFPVGVGEAV